MSAQSQPAARRLPQFELLRVLCMFGIVVNHFFTYGLDIYGLNGSAFTVPVNGFLDAALWGVFWLGDFLSSLMVDFARPQVDPIYGMKDGENPVVLSLLLLFIIGPAEEIFWRGYIQKSFSKRWTPTVGFIVTTLIYSLVHVSKMNFMLIMAAAVAGIIWGLAYRFFPERLGAIIISHALWDCAVFVWFPIM